VNQASTLTSTFDYLERQVQQRKVVERYARVGWKVTIWRMRERRIERRESTRRA
jgi:hypothetical protein